MDRIQEMEALAASAVTFSPAAWFEPELDQIVFHANDHAYFERRVDRLLTIFIEKDNPDKVTGFKVKGFNWVYKRLVIQGRAQEDGFIELIALLDYAWTVAVATVSADDNQIDRTYQKAKKMANNYTVSIDDVRMTV